jgi:hypothetical protein
LEKWVVRKEGVSCGGTLRSNGPVAIMVPKENVRGIKFCADRYYWTKIEVVFERTRGLTKKSCFFPEKKILNERSVKKQSIKTI